MTHGAPSKNTRAAWVAGIILVSACAGMIADWSAPGLQRYAQDRLMRARGRLPAPDDIVILAIDDASIRRLGRFPWPRSTMARVIDALAAAGPKVIALDVLYTDPTTPAEDGALARAIAHAGNVVVAAELAEPPGAGPVSWLQPLPELEQAAAAVGHVNVLAESEGVGRGILIRMADDSGRSFRAMAVEAVRIADRTPEQAVTDAPHAVLVGQRVLPVETAEPAMLIRRANAGSVDLLRAARMAIDYIGPTGSFAGSTCSVADLLDGRIPPARFRGKNVLIGATAASIGDRLPSPFTHAPDAQADLHGTLMPGVEVLANCVNTILRSRFYSSTPGWLAFVIAALMAGVTLALLAAAQGGHEFLKQMLVLAGVAAAIVICGEMVFKQLLLFPPLTSTVVAFASAGILGLVRRSMATGVHLDETIAKLAQAEGAFAPQSDAGGAAESIARLSAAAGVAIYETTSGAAGHPGQYRLIGSWGAPAAKRALLESEFAEALVFQSGGRDRFEICTMTIDNGVLLTAHTPGHAPSRDRQRVCAAIAAAAIASYEEQPANTRGRLRGAEQKARTLGRLNQRLLERSRFVDFALRSVDDGLVIATADGRITFANQRAAEVLRSKPEKLAGASLFERLSMVEEQGRGGSPPQHSESEMLQQLLVERARIEREITVRNSRPRQFTVRMAAVTTNEDESGPVLGIVASLSDVTRHHQLQQTKNDVVALVSHEMRTPLTAIQGMSELLSSYDMDAARRKEMSGVINSEARRLTRMITDYLDIARLESGATVIRPAPQRLETLVERALLLLDPIASGREIRVTRRFGDVEPIIADADLLSRAVTNLVTNAIHYSPAGSEVVVSTRESDSGAVIEVRDEGYGIAPGHLDRIFEKFYRVPRVEDADVPGTGLGLALVREIAELHGGAVRVWSEAGAGSTFSLFLPRNKPTL